MSEITLQINLTPADLSQASLIVPHQLNIWASMCQEILIVWDLDPGERYVKDPIYHQLWDCALPFIHPFNQALKMDFPEIKIIHLTPKVEIYQHLARIFFLKDTELPSKDYRGRPIASYLYGLEQAKNDLVFHLDGDILFSGAPLDWIEKAHNILTKQRDVFCLMPPMGPNQETRPQRYINFTARTYLLDRRLLYRQLQMSYYDPNDKPNTIEKKCAELLENSITQLMLSKSMWRIVLPDSNPYFCSLHPPDPPAENFIKYIPSLVEKLAKERLPECQNGYYNLQLETLKFFYDCPSIV